MKIWIKLEENADVQRRWQEYVESAKYFLNKNITQHYRIVRQ